MKSIYSLFILIAFSVSIQAQISAIEMPDTSFESEPEITDVSRSWSNVGIPEGVNTPPSDLFDATQEALSGKKLLGLVTKDDNVWESVTQSFNVPLEEGKCYEFSVYLAKAVTFSSNIKIENDKDYNNGVVLRVWGGPDHDMKKEKLAESSIIDHSNWQQYKFKLSPSNKAYNISLEAHFKTPILMPNGGNILIDNISEVLSIDCGTAQPLDNDELVVETTFNKVRPQNEIVISKLKTNEIKKSRVIVESKYKDIRKGRTVNIDKLTFAADAYKIEQVSYSALDEIYSFLKENEDLVVEISGHTNSIPSHATCKELSTNRAKSVANYLINKGLSNLRVKYKGYGKFKPKYSNKTAQGRKGNQRVEIKVVRING